jgi:hypothetical protein
MRGFLAFLHDNWTDMRADPWYGLLVWSWVLFDGYAVAVQSGWVAC